jgi:hypothetical protein
MTPGAAPIPQPIRAFGLATIVPFVVSAGLYDFGPPSVGPWALLCLLSWSAVTLAFLGGVRGGLEAAHPSPRWSVVLVAFLPPMAGFLLLIGGRWFDPVWQLSGFIVAFILTWLWDTKDIEGPAWRPRYRTIITLGAAVTLGSAVEQAMHM